MATRTAGLLPAPSAATMSSGTCMPVAVLPPRSTVARNLTRRLCREARFSRRPSIDDLANRIAATMSEPTKFTLPESAIPRQWINLLADLPPGAPPLHPGTKEPVGPDDLAPLFPMGLIEQEVSAEPEIPIPDEI